MTFLELKLLTPELLPAVIELDRLCFGGLWTLEGYQRELDSPNSDLLVLVQPGEQPHPQTLSVQREGRLARSREQDNREDYPITNAQCPMPYAPCPISLLGIGCLWAILDEAHITIVGVHPSYQRQGLGQALLWALLNSAVTRGLERATLEVRASNLTALSLYQKFGFQTAGVRRHYYQDNEDALILWRSGLQHPNFQQTLAEWERQIGDRLVSFGWNLQFSIKKKVQPLDD